MNDDERDQFRRAGAMAHFAVAKTQVAGGTISQFPDWFMANICSSMSRKDKYIISFDYSTEWKPFLEPNQSFETVLGTQCIVTRNAVTGQRESITVQHGCYEVNHVILFEGEVDLEKNCVRFSRVTDLRVINPECLYLRRGVPMVSAKELEERCLAEIDEEPFVDFPKYEVRKHSSDR